MNYKVLNGVFLLIGCALSPEVYAVCKPSNNFKTVDIDMNVGRVVVKPSDEIGTVLRKSSFPINPNLGSIISCDVVGGTFQAILSKYPLLTPAKGQPSVYSTNIPGIGMRLSIEAGNNPIFSGYYPYSKPLSKIDYKLDEGFFIVEIIKTATITGLGALAPGQYSSYNSPDDVTKPFLTSTIYGNGITIASSSCKLSGNVNKTVQLPTVNKSGFKGIGSTQGEKAFNLQFSCDSGENPKISLNFDYTAAPNTTNVLINEAAKSKRAGGVGIQLKTNYNNQSKIIAKNENLKLDGLNTVPLSASYYQTDSVVSPGKVKSTATVTIQYE